MAAIRISEPDEALNFTCFHTTVFGFLSRLFGGFLRGGPVDNCRHNRVFSSCLPHAGEHSSDVNGHGSLNLKVYVFLCC